jgi:GTPase Era involved in 16S rRNA processing
MGFTGAGKTTLLNKLCGTNHIAGVETGSVTKLLFENCNNIGSYPFKLIDTPGTDSTTETYHHAYLLRHALTAKNINTIFLVMKNDNRYDRMENDFLKLISPVYSNSHKFALLISHWDLSEENDKEYDQIKKKFSVHCPNIICYSKESDLKKVADLMYCCMTNMYQEKLVIPREDFFINFNLHQISTEMKKEYIIHEKIINQRREAIIEFLKDVNTIPIEERDDLLQSINIQSKYDFDEILNQFTEKMKGEMIELNYYCFLIKLQKEVLAICSEIANYIKPLMTFNLDDTNDPRNSIKACPYCQEIWIRVEGCAGITTCGNLPEFKDVDRNKRFFSKFSFRMENNKITYEKVKLENNRITSPNTTNFKTSYSRRGCGNQIKWSELPCLDDKTLVNIFQIKSIDEVKRIINNVRFSTVFSETEKGYDISFHN